MSYNGNHNLSSSREVLEFSAEQILEYDRCSRDAEYFIENYVKIISVDHGVVPFRPYEFQKEIFNTAIANRFVVCKMPRQCGKTTAIVGLLLWYVLFNEGFSIAILANKLAQAREILSRLQFAYENLPKWIQQGIVEWNKGNIELANRSSIIASATSSSAIRGTSQNLIYLDEFAFVQNTLQEEFFASVYPTISSGKTSKVLITSTPNGMNMFHKIWKDSEDGRNDYKRVSVHWSGVPGRDEKWKEETIRNTSAEQFRQEYECEFLGSSNTLIDPNVLMRLTYSNPIHQNSDIKVYSEPTAGRLYAIVVDSSRALGQDYSAFTVTDISSFPYQVVARYRNNKISSLLYPDIVYKFARHYNNALVLVESNDIGKQVADILYYDLEYENTLFTSNEKGSQTISGGFAGTQMQIGVKTSKSVKKIGCSVLKTLIESDRLFINDHEILQELYRFSAKGESFEAEEGNDDLVMTLVLLAWMINQPYIKEVINNDVRRSFSETNQRMIEDDLTPFGLIDDKQPEETEVVKAVSDDRWLLFDGDSAEHAYTLQ